MRKTLLLLSIVSLALFGCGEAGVELDVTKGSTVTIQISRNLVNSDVDNFFSTTQTVNFADDDFEEYIGDAESVIIDKLTYQFKDYNNISGDLVLMDITLGTGSPNNSILDVFGLVVENTGTVLAYETGNPESALSAAQIANLESLGNQILARQNITFNASADFTDDIDSDFVIEFTFDVTLRVTGE